MQGTITQHLAGLAGESQQKAVRVPMKAIGDRLSSQTLNTAALRIKGGSASPTVQSNAASAFVVNGKLVTKATSTDMAALSGSVTNAKFNVFAFFIDAAGVLTSAMGIEAVILAGVSFPAVPEGKAVIGFIIVNPTGTGAFVGGTTNLDDGTVVPNAVFVNTLGAFDPTVLV